MARSPIEIQMFIIKAANLHKGPTVMKGIIIIMQINRVFDGLNMLRMLLNFALISEMHEMYIFNGS